MSAVRRPALISVVAFDVLEPKRLERIVHELIEQLRHLLEQSLRGPVGRDVRAGEDVLDDERLPALDLQLSLTLAVISSGRSPSVSSELVSTVKTSMPSMARCRATLTL